MSTQLLTKKMAKRNHHKQRLPDGNLLEFLVAPDEAGAKELTTPFDPHQPASPPTREEIQQIFEAAARYGHWMGSPEDNAAIGLSLT